MCTCFLVIKSTSVYLCQKWKSITCGSLSTNFSNWASCSSRRCAEAVPWMKWRRSDGRARSSASFASSTRSAWRRSGDSTNATRPWRTKNSAALCGNTVRHTFIRLFIELPPRCSGVVIEYRTRKREAAGSTHTPSTASNIEQVANLLYDQANSASYPHRDGKWVVATTTVNGWRPSVDDWGDSASASCTVGPIIHVYWINPLDSKDLCVPHQIIRSWYTGRWWVSCYIWYSEEGPGRAAAPPSLLLGAPNVTAHPSTASVPTTVQYCYMMVRCSAGLNVAIKGLNSELNELWMILIMCRWCRSSGFLSEVPKNGAYPKKLCFRFGQRAADMYAARCQSRTC